MFVYLHVSACNFVCREHATICIYLTIKSEYESQQKMQNLSFYQLQSYPPSFLFFLFMFGYSDLKVLSIVKAFCKQLEMAVRFLYNRLISN